tara:strand:- start:32 stop:493 length:462 start_codon:yes stop_codon:yes gene_type:complete
MKVNTLWGEEVLTKVCIACKERKPISDYIMRNYTKSPKGETINTCKRCKKKEGKLLSKYKKQYPLPDSDYKCKGCLLTENEIKSRGGWEHHIAKKTRTVWRVDHCHETGRFRAYICDYCNNTLGRALDNPDTLRRLADYVEYYSGKKVGDSGK